MSRTIDARIRLKHDTTEHWNSTSNFAPLKGEIIIYDDYEIVDGKNIPNIKIGDGLAYVQDLPFVDSGIRDQLIAHINNQGIHVTQEEKDFWNNKINIDDASDILYDELIDETLIFTRL